MNKKGFTLIELLGVVTLIALISIIAIPKITNNFLNKKNEISEANQKLLAAATDTYIENNKGIYNNSYESNGSTYCIPVQTLIDKGILEKPFKNINGKEIDYTNKIKATYQAEYNSFDYELVDSCEELIQYVSRPQLEENMIPVIYNEETSSWVKADDKSHWYNYSEKNWANAVVVNEYKSTEQNSKSRYEYVNAPAGTPILESDILGYFVWIPRFRYQLFESSSEKEINIVFESVATPKSAGVKKNEWLTHPAFTYNNQELSGIWFGKYVVSYNNGNLVIIPHKYSDITEYNNAYNISVNMTNENNIYGFKNVNTHLTRNSEWAAAAYLTDSKYGIKKVMYNTSTSTTYNKSGIYDMTNRSGEYVIVETETEDSLGYGLSETNKWNNNNYENSFITEEKPYLIRGDKYALNYKSYDSRISHAYRIVIINNNTTVNKKSEIPVFQIVNNVKYFDSNWIKNNPMYYDPINGKCTIEDYKNNTDKLGKTGCLRWYAYSENADKTLNLLLDHNTSNEIFWSAYEEDGYSSHLNLSKLNADHGPTGLLYQLYLDTKDWTALKDLTSEENYSLSCEYDFNSDGAINNNEKWNYTVDYTKHYVENPNYRIMPNFESQIELGEEKYNTVPGAYKARTLTAEEIAFITGMNTEANPNNWIASKGIYFYYASLNANYRDYIDKRENGRKYGWLLDYMFSDCEYDGCIKKYPSFEERSDSYLTTSTFNCNGISGWVLERGSINMNTKGGIRPVIRVNRNDVLILNY